METVKKYLAIASIATACALLAGCSSDKADEIYARLQGQNPEVLSLAAEMLGADGLSDDQLPEGVEVALNRSALASNDLSLYDAPSPVGSVVGSVPAGERVQVTGVVRRPDGARWYDVQYQGASGYTCGGLDFSADAGSDSAADPEATVTPEATLGPEATVTPEPTIGPEATVTPEPTLDPDTAVTPEPTMDPDATQAPEPSLAPTETPALTPEPAPEPSQTLSPTLAPIDLETPAPSETPAPVETPLPESTADVSAEPTDSPEPDWPAETALHATGVVQKDNVRLRAHPSTQEKTVASIDGGVCLTVVSCVRMPDGDWYGVLWQGGKAYVRGDMVALSVSPSDTPEPTQTPDATTAPDITATPEPTAAPDITAAPESTETALSILTPEVTPDAAATPSPEPTPEPTPQPTPEPTPEPTSEPTREAAQSPA